MGKDPKVETITRSREGACHGWRWNGKAGSCLPDCKMMSSRAEIYAPATGRSRSSEAGNSSSLPAAKTRVGEAKPMW